MTAKSTNKTSSNRHFSSWTAVALVAAVCLPALAVSQAFKPTIPQADRHQQGKVFLEHADRLVMDQNQSGGEYQVLNGNVVFRKGDMYMYCDSAHFYDKSNSLDAFSNVRMQQGDTLFVYANQLNYSGPDEFATLYGSAGNPVRMINRDVKLVTDVFYYDLRQNYGYYDAGGVLTDKQNRLESVRGEYYPSTKNADFYDNVELRSRNQQGDTLLMYTDALHYNTNSHVATITAPTRIINRDGTILTSSGTYNTNNGVGDLYDRSTVVSKKGNTLTADTLFYDRNKGIGKGFGRVVITDSIKKMQLLGNYGYYNEKADSAYVTGRALAKQYKNNKDTLYLHGDIINAYKTKPDSINVTNVFRGVRFYRDDVQGICDSLSFTDSDSIMRMFYSPVIWSDKRQIFGNLIEIHMNDSTADRANLPDFGFMADHVLEDCYNQLSGNRMTAWFNDSVINRLYVEGNVQVIMFPMEADSAYNKFAFAESSFMDAYFKNGQIDTVKMWPETTGRVTPLFLAKKGSYFLPKFKWMESLRPTSPESVFDKTEDPQGLLAPISTGNAINPDDYKPKRKKKEKEVEKTENPQDPKESKETAEAEIAPVEKEPDNNSSLN